MSNQATDIIDKYEVLFAVRTGVTILTPKVAAFDGGDKTPISFTVSRDNPRDALIKTGNTTLLLKGMKKEHLDDAVARGFMMFYETKNDDIIRSTLCHYRE